MQEPNPGGLPLRIIHITFNFPPEIGGVGQYVYNLSDYVKKRGIEVVVITLPTTASLRQLKPKPFPVFAVKVLRLPFSDPIPLNLFGLLRTLVKTQKFNVLHLHGHLSFLSFFGALFSKLLNIPYVVTHHGEGLQSSLVSRINGHLRRSLIAKYVLGHSKMVISVTQNEVAALTGKYGISKDKITVIPNGVNIDQFNSSPPIFNEIFPSEWRHKKVVLSGGVLARWKGFEYLIRAMNLVVNEYGDARVIITGDGPDRLRLQGVVNSLGIGNFVKFTGRIETDLIPSFYSLSYMYVLPSLYDVCPTTVLEAMASKKPVVVTSNGGQRELVVDNVNGIVVPPANVESLCKAILTLLSFQELALKMGIEGKKIAEEKFQWSTLGDKILKEYRNLVPFNDVK
jgi:glycosyltransferase involved in cell wall biosynthesis